MLDTLAAAASQGYAGASEFCKRVYYNPWNVNLTLENTIGKGIAKQVKNNPVVSQGIADTISGVAYGFVVGTAFDTGIAHLTPEGWLSARALSLVANAIVSGPYGRYVNFIYKLTNTKKESSTIRKTATDLFTFITGQSVPIFAIYAGATFAEGGEVNWTKVGAGMRGFILYSPLIAPTLNWTLRKLREYCELPTGQTTETLSPKCQSCTAQSPAPASLKE